MNAIYQPFEIPLNPRCFGALAIAETVQAKPVEVPFCRAMLHRKSSVEHLFMSPWVVSEYSSGRAIADGKTPEEAVENARKKLEKFGEAALKQVIKKFPVLNKDPEVTG